MDSSGVAHVQNVTSPRRPRTQQSLLNSSFRHLPIIKDARDYIMITQDILDAFKEQVVKSHKVNLNLTNVRLRSSKKGINGRRHFPPLLEERMRLIHNKSHTSLDLRENVRNKPVKVFVDDITQKYGVCGSEVTSGSGRENDLLPKRKHTLKRSERLVKR